MAQCVHHVPGRARFKVPKLQFDPDFAAEIEQKVLAVDGVRDVEVNRHACSVIVHYDADANPLDDVIGRIAADRPANGANGDRSIDVPPPVGSASGRPGRGAHDMSQAVGHIIGQAIFATIVRRTLDRSLLSILTGLR